jgi:uncharacterized lipoprotein YmbA
MAPTPILLCLLLLTGCAYPHHHQRNAQPLKTASISPSTSTNDPMITVVPIEVPAPLGLLGVTAMFTTARRLRKRIREGSD